MGTRSEIYIRNAEEMIELWKHWDGYPDNMLPLFQEFIKWADDLVRDQKHWLTYPIDISAMLIAFDFKEICERHQKYDPDTKKFAYDKPDIRPKGTLRDAEYVYVLETENYDFNARLRVPEFRLICFRCSSFNGLDDDDIELVRTGSYDVLATKHKKLFDKKLRVYKGELQVKD